MAAYTAPIRSLLGILPQGKGSDEPYVTSRGNGWASPGSTVDNEPVSGTKAWTNDTSAQTYIINANGTAEMGINDSLGPVQYLHFHAFDLDIPSGATIVGVTAMVDLLDTSGFANVTIDDWYLTFDDGGGGWNLSATNKGGIASPTTDGELTAGGAADMWGEGSITPTQANNAEFGFSFRMSSTTVSPSFDQFKIKSGGIKVDYTDTPDGRIEVAQQYLEVVRSTTVAAAPAPNFARVIVVT